MNGSADLRRGILPESPKLRRLILLVLAAMAAISTHTAIKEALVKGTDFQWSGAHILAQHQDPWKIYIAGDPKGQIILGQQPNYLAEFFLLLGPLGRMPFPQALAWWCGLNLVFLAGVVFCLRGMFHLDCDHTVLVALLVLSSTPFRVTMANGQHGIFILLLFTLVFYLGNRFLRGAALGISYGKYSFAPLMVMVLLLRRQFTVFFVSLIPPAVGVLIAYHMLGGSLKTLALEPFATAKLAMGPGAGDVMTPVEIAMRHFGASASAAYSVPAMLGLASAVVAALWIARNKRLTTDAMTFAVVIVMTLLCFKHVLYDFVVLVVPVAAAVMAPKSRARTVVLLCMVHFWFFTSIVNHFFPLRVYAPEVVIYAILLLVMAIATSHLDEPSSADHAPVV